MGDTDNPFESAADDLAAASVARDRLTSPPEDDVTLEELATELGFDLEQVRREVEAGDPRAQLSTS
jgi:hypothetical protein